MLCILYVNVMGFLFGTVGHVVERALPTAVARRWVWCVVIAASVFVPGYYRVNHNVLVAEVLGEQASAPGHTLNASLSPLDPRWWSHMESYDGAVSVAWRIASALLLLWGLYHLWRVSRLLREARATDSGDARLLVDGVPVVITESAGPATVGLFRSRVVVPRWVLALPGVQRQYVLRHEEEHRRAHDARLLFLASLSVVLLPWNLAFWWQLRRLRLAVEIDCDNRVVAALGDAPAYGQLLFRVAEASSRGPRLQPAFLGGPGMLERRLRMLLDPSPRRPAQRFLLPVLAVALLAFVLSVPHPVTGSDAHDHVATVSAPRAGGAP